MKAWTKIMARPTKANLAFALLSLLALFVVAWSRTDFSSPQTPIPTSDPQHNNALYAPLDIQLGPDVQEIAPIDAGSTSSTNSGTRSVPSSVTVEPLQQTSPPSTSRVAPIIQSVTETLTNVVLAPSVNLTIDVPVATEPTDQTDCAAVLVLEVCLE